MVNVGKYIIHGCYGIGHGLEFSSPKKSTEKVEVLDPDPFAEIVGPKG